MTDAAQILAELRALRAAVEALRRERDTLAPAPRRLAALLPRLYAPCEPFTSSHLVELARLQPVRRDLAEVLRRDFATDARRVGIALRAIADAGHAVEGLRLVALPGERRWELVPVESA